MFEKPISVPPSVEHKESNFPSGKSISIFLLFIILVASIIFVGYVLITSPAINNYVDDKKNKLLSPKSGAFIEEINKEDFVNRELEKWDGGETNTKFSRGEIPNALKVSGFENLYITEISKGGPRGEEIEFNLRNLGEETIVISIVQAIVSVEFANNKGVFEEYKVDFFPQGEEKSLRAYAIVPARMNIESEPENSPYKNPLLGTFIESYEIVKFNIE